MKKICYVTTIPGTIRTFILKSAEYLYSTGEFDISLISSPDEEIEKEFPSYFHFFPVKMKRGISFDGLRVIREIRDICARERFDLIQYSTPNASFYTSIAAKRAGIPVRLYCQWGIVYVGFEGIKRRIFKQIEKIVCYNSTWIEPDSHGNLNFSHEEGLYPLNKGSVIWNGSASGVSFEKFNINKKPEYREKVRKQHNISDDAFVFGFVGRVTRDKGINELFEAYKRIYESYPNSYLIIVGLSEISDGVDSDLYNWAQGNKNVIFTGRVPIPEQYMSAMDCFVLPSYREGFGMTVIEAESMGVPVIVSNIPGPTDGMIDSKTGLIVQKKDADGLYNAMKQMLESPEMVKHYGENAHLYVTENFDQKVFFEKILEDRRRLLEI